VASLTCEKYRRLKNLFLTLRHLFAETLDLFLTETAGKKLTSISAFC
jgi:hypothetical protein